MRLGQLDEGELAPLLELAPGRGHLAAVAYRLGRPSPRMMDTPTARTTILPLTDPQPHLPRR